MKVKVISLPYIFPGFVCFVLYKARISGERLQDHWSSGLISICVYIFFPVRDSVEPVHFHLHIQRQNDLLAVEIPNIVQHLILKVFEIRHTRVVITRWGDFRSISLK